VMLGGVGELFGGGDLVSARRKRGGGGKYDKVCVLRSVERRKSKGTKYLKVFVGWARILRLWAKPDLTQRVLGSKCFIPQIHVKPRCQIIVIRML
jgi:hypothetical protein